MRDQDMDTTVITTATASHPELVGLLEIHRSFCDAHTPSGSGHALAPEEAGREDERYWIAREADQPLGCVGLKLLTDAHAEVKSLHVLTSARGRGVGVMLMGCIIRTAQNEGISRLSLETGRSDAFAASRSLYRRMGFQACENFGPYAHDPFSYCMTARL